MPINILMPALSPTMEKGNLARWLKKEGDAIKSGDIIAEIETDKATMEVEAVDEGEVTDILVAEGTEGVKVNTPIARLKDEGGAAAPAPKAETANATAGAEPAKAESAAPAPVAAKVPATPAKADGTRVFASPLARRLAAQGNIDLSAIKGTGPHGRIVKRDLEGAPTGAARPARASTGSR